MLFMIRTYNEKILIYSDRIESSDGKIIRKLSHTELTLLRVLIDANNEVVERDKLIHHGWRQKVVVGNSLNMAIMSIRRALDAFGMGECVKTIPRKGFLLENPSAFLFSSDVSANTKTNHALEGEPEAKNEFFLGGGGVAKNESIKTRVSPPPTTPKKNFKSIVSFFIFTLILLDLWFYVQISSRKPHLTCELINKNATLCARYLDSSLFAEARKYLLLQGERRKVVLWADKINDTEHGYEFYLVKHGWI